MLTKEWLIKELKDLEVELNDEEPEGYYADGRDDAIEGIERLISKIRRLEP